MSRLFVGLIAACLFSSTGRGAIGSTIAIDAFDRGAYGDSGIHPNTNVNYAAGYSDATQTEFRNFFAFDLPARLAEISSAQLRLNVAFYFSDDPTEELTLYDVLTPVDELIAGGVRPDIFDDLGSGIEFGSRTVAKAEGHTIITIDLNRSAIESINNSIGMHWAIGGALTSIDPVPTTGEALFGLSSSVPFSETQLILTTIPAPAVLGPIVIAAMATRRRVRH